VTAYALYGSGQSASISVNCLANAFPVRIEQVDVFWPGMPATNGASGTLLPQVAATAGAISGGSSNPLYPTNGSTTPCSATVAAGPGLSAVGAGWTVAGGVTITGQSSASWTAPNDVILQPGGIFTCGMTVAAANLEIVLYFEELRLQWAV
jgi:hypothetical protein